MPEGLTSAERARLDRPIARDVAFPARLNEQPPPAPDLPDSLPPNRGRRVLRWSLILGGATALALGGTWYWLTGGRLVTTNNAYVQANVLNVATDVSGIVADIPVQEGKAVVPGEILFRLDPAAFRIAVDRARANLNQVALTLEASRADYHKAESDRAAQAANVQNDQAAVDRYSILVRQRDVSVQQYDEARFRLQASQAQLAAAEAQVRSALVRLGGQSEKPVAEMPAYQEARAALNEAERQLRQTEVRAPYAGTVTQVAKLQPGQFLAAGSPAFGLVGTDGFWVLTQPKETELTCIRPGQKATVTIDAYPGTSWDGIVQSIAPATDQQFAILPAQNSSGNWVKVVQRVPMRVSLQPVPDAPALSAGMSAEVTVDTHHERHLSDLVGMLTGETSHGG